MSVRIINADVRVGLRQLLDEGVRVQTVVTSPPYFGLRDYGVEGQIGLEASPQEYVETMVDVFRLVRDVLADDGTLWLNLGDSYAAPRATVCNTPSATKSTLSTNNGRGPKAGDKYHHANSGVGRKLEHGVKPKDLIGIPWMVAFALRSDGWWLRQDIIWAKPNPMPESVTDRCTKAHEYIFLLSKSERYYFDAEAISETAISDHAPGNITHKGTAAYQSGDEKHRTKGGLLTYAQRARKYQTTHAGMLIQSGLASQSNHHGPFGRRNRRSVWTVATQPFREAHFATFPPDLIEPCILAGAPEGGTVLDPFGGAGTTGLVADRHKRNAILIELNSDYAEMARNRIANDAPLFAEVL